MSWSSEDTESSIPARFAEVARRNRGRTAVSGTSWRPTYEELDSASDAIAAGLRARAGEGPGVVALAMRHDAPLVASVLGVLKAGKTALALDPGGPPEHRGAVLAQVGPQVVLEDPGGDAGAGGGAGNRVEEPSAPVRPRDLALLIHTSGSTGRARTVMQTHRNMVHNAMRHTRGLGLVAEDRIALLGALSGGQGMGTLWSALLNGATVCPFPIMERGMAGLADWLECERISVLGASTSVLRRFAATLGGRRVEGLRLVRLASEPSVYADLEALRASFGEACEITNTFSSSETGNITRCTLNGHEGPPQELLPAGRPAEGIRVSVLGADGAEAPPGEEGEIVVHGDHLSPGYWREEALTAERHGDGLFRTGDIGVRSRDGLLTVTGRRDSRVKVRGRLVDPAEAERLLISHPRVAAGAVHAEADAPGEVRLTAYLEPSDPGEDLDTTELRRWLARALPDAAVPTAYVVTDSLALTPHGKVDRARFAPAGPECPPEPPSATAMSATEEVLAAIWARALDRERVGREEDFFDAGGESLTAAVIAAEVYDAFGAELELRAFAEHPTVAAMARLIEEPRAGAPARLPLRRTLRSASLPSSFIQEHVWRTSQLLGSGAKWTTAEALALRGPLDAGALRRAIGYLVGRHEALRTTFVEHDGRLYQVVRDPGSFEVPLVDLRDEADPRAAAEELLSREAAVEFDLERGPLLRMVLARLGDDEHRLMRISHHIVTDAWSWQLFFRELAALYEADVAGMPPPLPARTELGYADFAAWERRSLDPAGAAYREELDWWRRTLEGSPGPPRLPFARAEPAPEAEPADGAIWWGLDPEVSGELDRVGREGAATFYMVRLAVFAARLALDAGEDDLELASYVTNRRLPELQAMFGFFNNVAILRLRHSPELSFAGWLARVRTVVLETAGRTTIPHQRLWADLGDRGLPAPDVRVIFSTAQLAPRLDFGGLEAELQKRGVGTMPWGFVFGVHRWLESEACRCAFDAHIYDPDGVRAFIDRYRELAAAVAEAPDVPMAELSRER